ncbi:hypothetical protein I6A62_04790, partial [Frankia sp. AgW1.1]|nr:hypothetical protein [Frankia sp. AgW1.1]
VKTKLGAMGLQLKDSPPGFDPRQAQQPQDPRSTAARLADLADRARPWVRKLPDLRRHRS